MGQPNLNPTRLACLPCLRVETQKGNKIMRDMSPKKEQFLNLDFMSISHENTVQVAVNVTHELIVKELANLLRVKRFLYHVFS